MRSLFRGRKKKEEEEDEIPWCNFILYLHSINFESMAARAELILEEISVFSHLPA